MVSDGLWRRVYGAQIVESFYDFDARQIGPYTLPIEAHCQRVVDVGSRAMPLSIYYTFMQKYNNAYAVWGVNNKEIVMYTPTGLVFVVNPSIDGNFSEMHKQHFRGILKFPAYRHIGYIKTFQRCVSVYPWPWYLFVDDNNVCLDFGGVTVDDAVENPPLKIYKDLVYSDFDAVYQSVDGSIKFIQRRR